MVLLEVCVETAAAAAAAEAAGAGRLELCARLDLDGLTPPDDLVAAVVGAARIPVHVMIRPEPGPFVADDGRLALMLAQGERAKALGAAGLVFGLLEVGDDDGGATRLDLARTAALVEAARPLAVTFHRAFDRVAEPGLTLEELIGLGVERVLTSGGAPDADTGRPVLAGLVAQAAGRIVVLPGGGVRAHNAARILADTGASELHASVPFDTSALG